MGELFNIFGALRFTPLEACPAALRKQSVTLKCKDGGDTFALPAEAACISAHVRRVALKVGVEEAIEIPLKKAVVVKVVDYLKHHSAHPFGQIVSPLLGSDLMECGATRWEARFVEVDKGTLFDLNLAASLLDIPALFFLTSAKAALVYKDKSAEKLRKEFNFLNDLPQGEEEEMGRGLRASGKARHEDVNADIAALAVTLQGTTAAAEKQGVVGMEGRAGVDPKSWRHACWRAAVLLDWKALAAAPAEVCGDRDLILGAIMPSEGMALSHASAAIRADRSVVLEATKYSGAAFREASAELRQDREFVLEAIAAHGGALGGAGEVLRRDRAFVLEAARRGHGSALQGAADQLRNDPDFALEVVAAAAAAAEHAGQELRMSRAFALRAAARNGRSLQFLPEKFRADREVVEAAVGENPAAVIFAHPSRRNELGMDLPWDSQEQLRAEYRNQQGDACAMEVAQAQVGPRMLIDPHEQEQLLPYRRHKLQKCVQFSAMSTMIGNMGQSNYTAANIFLDKIPALQRPEFDSVCLMWGAVGGIGMRWKAFASADILNDVPEALLSIEDCSRALFYTCCKMDAPEWYSVSMFDEGTRNGFITVYSGGGSGGGWKPSQDRGYPTLRGGWRPEVPKMDDLRPRAHAAGLGQPAVATAASEASPPQPRPSYPLEVGAWVELVGLSSKTGKTGILTKELAGGKWKVSLDDGAGNAMLREHYLKVILPAEEVRRKLGNDAIPELRAGVTAMELREAKQEERKSRAKERMLAREAQQQVSVGVF